MASWTGMEGPLFDGLDDLSPPANLTPVNPAQLLAWSRALSTLALLVAGIAGAAFASGNAWAGGCLAITAALLMGAGWLGLW